MKIPFIGYAALVSFVFPTTTGIYLWKRQSKAMRVFLALSCITVVEIIISFGVGRLHLANNFVSNYYRIIEVEMILIFYLLWTKKGILAQILKLLGVSFFCLWLVDKFFIEDASKINSMMAIVARVVIIIATIAVLSQVLRESDIPLLKHPLFWAGTGELLYCAGTVLVLGFANSAISMGIKYFTLLWYLNWTSAILANALYTKSYLCEY